MKQDIDPAPKEQMTETYVPVPKQTRRSREFGSISSIFNPDFLRLKANRYGKLLRVTRSTRSPRATFSTPTVRTAEIFNNNTEPPQSSTCKGDRLSEEAASEECDRKCLAPPNSSSVRSSGRSSSPYIVPMLQDNNKAAAPLRIVRRRCLFNRRRGMCNVSVGLASVGMFLMMVDMEITRWNHPTSAIGWEYWPSLFLKLLVVMTTAGLVASIVAYHAIEIQIYLMESGAEDWKVAMTARRIFLLLTEILLCAICPLPGIDHVRLTYPDLVLRSMPSCNTDGGLIYQSQVPVNVLLSIPMFARSYLVCRIMVLHSKQFQDTTIWSIASFNHVTVNFKFVAKTLLSDHPLKVLVVSTVTACCCAAWMFTQCERYSYVCEAGPCSSYFDSLWLVVITLLSVGYGDVIPHTYCGRFVAIFTGMAGMGVSAAVISVMTGKIGLTRWERQVNSFVTDSKLAVGKRNAAATVLQETWLIHKHKKNNSVPSKLQVVRHQRKFLQAITRFRNVKIAQRSLITEKEVEFVDVRKIQREVQETVADVWKAQMQLANNLSSLATSVTENQTNNDVKYELLRENFASILRNQENTLEEMISLKNNIRFMQIQLDRIANPYTDKDCVSSVENQ